MIPDWKLPPGVDRGAWDYAHSANLARGYDDALDGTPLLRHDVAFCERHFSGPGPLVDLGCGTGRLLVPFARKGYPVVGVDLSGEMLGVAAAKLAAAGLAGRLIRANLAELDGLRSERFDHAACLFSTLGMVRGADNRRAVLGHAFRLLRPGGRFVLHVHNRWYALRDRPGRRWLRGNAWNSLRGRAEIGDRTMPQHYGGAPLTLHHFTRGGVLRLLASAGFTVEECVAVSAGPDALPPAGPAKWLRAYGFLIACRRPVQA